MSYRPDTFRRSVSIMTGDQGLAAVARRMIAMRQHRKSLFPKEMFDEYGWNMLLHLFVSHANNTSLAESQLIQLADAAPETGRRWIQILVQEGQVRVVDGDVLLASDTVERLRLYLREYDPATALPPPQGNT